MLFAEVLLLQLYFTNQFYHFFFFFFGGGGGGLKVVLMRLECLLAGLHVASMDLGWNC
jgi:hypothetical protein